MWLWLIRLVVEDRYSKKIIIKVKYDVSVFRIKNLRKDIIIYKCNYWKWFYVWLKLR